MRWAAPVCLQPAILAQVWEGVGRAVCREGRGRSLKHALCLILHSLLDFPCTDSQESFPANRIAIYGWGWCFPPCLLLEAAKESERL